MPDRRVISLLPLAFAVLAMIAAQPSSATSPGTTRVNVASDGAESNGGSSSPAMSRDGRFVAFYSEATDLVAGDTGLCDMDFDGQANENCGDIFLHDTQTGVTEIVSVNSQGVQANGPSGGPSISADGRFVTFLSLASNLVNADTNNETDVFIRDRALGVTERVSVDSDEAQGPRHSEAAINADGRFVAFESCGFTPAGETGLCAIGGLSVRSHIYVRDRQAGTTTRVSVDSDGVDANGDSFDPDISDDGRFVTFYSRASNLVAGDTNTCVEFPTAGQCEDVFVHDRATGRTERVSIADSGTQGNRPSRYPSISGDGRFVAFDSWATNLVPGDTNSMDDVFLRDRLTGTLRRASLNAMGGELDGPSRQATLSRNGRYLGFESGATNLVADDTNDCGSDVPPSCPDVFVQDTLTSITVRTSVSSSGEQAPSGGVFQSISGDGRRMSFESGGPNLVPGDNNNIADIFVHDLGDSDNDGEWDPFDPCPSNPDCDGDGFADGAERLIGTSPSAACGVNAWPADVNNDGYSDISDVIPLLNYVGQAVPPAPRRYNIAPDPPNGFVDITDIVRMLNYFGKGCA